MLLEFPLPRELTEAIEAGRWPRDKSDVGGQDLRPRFSPAAIHVFAPEENTIVLYPPPFRTVRKCLDANKSFGEIHWATQEIVPEQVVLIADFGIGSETMLCLSYKSATEEPSVIRLQWRLPDRPNRWVHVSNSFAEFWKVLSVA